jgi:hypothetical protein
MLRVSSNPFVELAEEEKLPFLNVWLTKAEVEVRELEPCTPAWLDVVIANELDA